MSRFDARGTIPGMAWIFRGLVVAATLGLAGCMDAAGNRVTMQEWMTARKGAKGRETQEARPNPRDSVVAQESPTIAADVDRSRPEPAERDEFAPAHAPSSDAVRAEGLIVDDETIKVADILEPIQSRLPTLAAELPAEAYWRRVGEMIRAQVVEAVAQHLIWRKAHQQMTDELKPQLEKAVEKMEKDRINREFDGRETSYEKYLAKHGKTRDEVRDRLRRSLLIDSYLRDRLLPMLPQPRKQELWDFYQAHLEDFTKPARREMLLIDVPVAAFLNLSKPVTPADEQEATAKARRTIDDAAEELRNGASFEAVARKHSYGLHKEDGGNWGWITQTDGGAAPLQGHWEVPSRRLFELRPAETSGIIEAAKSFFIVKVGQIDPGKTMDFQEAQPEITSILRQQRFVKLRADFLQKELERSTLGSLDEFVRSVVAAIPSQGSATIAVSEEKPDAHPTRSPRLKTDGKKPAISPGH